MAPTELDIALNLWKSYPWEPMSRILLGMHLTPPLIGVTSGSGRCRRLSANHCFVGEPISSRGRLLRLFIRAAMAGRFLLSQLHQRSSLEIIAGSLALFWMSQASFRSGWNRFPRHTSANENLVSSDVVYHQSEKWGERSGAAKSSRPWQLPDGLVNVAQTSAGHGEARA